MPLSTGWVGLKWLHGDGQAALCMGWCMALVHGIVWLVMMWGVGQLINIAVCSQISNTNIVDLDTSHTVGIQIRKVFAYQMYIHSFNIFI